MIKDRFNRTYKLISLFLAIIHIFVFCLQDAAVVFAENLDSSQAEDDTKAKANSDNFEKVDSKQPPENFTEVDENKKDSSAKDSLQAVGNGGSPANNAYSDFNAGALQNLQPSLFTGALTYSVPISVPAGRKGIQPNVVLVYSSQSGNGILGMGWSLELGCIERSTKNGVPAYNNSQDTFIFKSGGSTTELVNIGGNEYRAKIEGSFMKFTLSGNYWIAKDKGGTTYYFGQAQSSQQAVDSDVFKWCLDKVKDVLGNYMALTYIKDANQIYPDKINYTGYSGENNLNPAFEVDFDYSDSVREDYSFSYRSNFLIRTNKLLQAVTVKQNGARIRKYSLSYEYSPSTKRALLSSITQYGLTDALSFPSIEFVYQEKPYSFSELSSWGNIHNFNNNDWAGIRFSGGAETRVDTFDINRDGLPDRVFRGYSDSQYNQLWVQLNNGSGFDDLEIWPGLANQSSNSKRACVRYGNQHGEVNTFDINGDALPDRIYHNYNNNYNQWEVQLNNGNGFENSVAWTNIDGFHYQPDYTKLWGFAYDPPVWGYIDLFDINGDGKPDRIIRWYQWQNYWNVQLNNGSGFNNAIQWPNVQHQSHISESYIRTGSSNIYFATFDINGDGLPDHLMDNNTGDDTWGVQFNNGRGFENLEEWGPLGNLYGSWSYMGYGDPACVSTVDINGDGLPDRVMRNHDNQFANWQVQINNGHGFEPIAEWGPIIHNNVSGRAHIRAGTQAVYVDFFDINGDGLPDRVMRGNDNYDHWDVQFNNGPTPDLLSGISNGIGGAATVTYDAYVGYDNTQPADKVKLSFPVNVVVGIQTNDGRGNTYSTKYEYDKAEFDYRDREFRGFGKVTTTDAQGNYSVNYFHQDDYKKGRLYCQETFDSSGRLFAKSENTWGVSENIYTGYPQARFVFLSESNIYTYEGDDSARRIRTGYLYQESPQYGNPTQIIEYGEVNTEDGSDIGQDKRITFTYYTYNSNDWIVCLPSRVVVKDINGNTVTEKYFYYDGHENIGEP
ncbi:MAG: toxin TcdB middle/N-terminal domain-containing protein, partial [Candidatus Omnitrophica bacterium]|nr:toxin TcdB middle/N-terminal domain-containing protein [Candidatus Omnitrophota bacterium]